MPGFQYESTVNPWLKTIGEQLGEPGRIEANRAIQVGQAQARAAEASGQAYSGAVQQLGQLPGQVIQQQRAGQLQALEAQKTKAQITDMAAQQQQRVAAADKAQKLDQMNQGIDTIMQKSMKDDPETGVSTFDRPTFEQGLVQAGMGHLYPQMAETLDKLDASASKRNAEGRSMLANSLVGVAQAGYTPEAVMSAGAYLKKNNLITQDHLAPVLDAVASDSSPQAIKKVIDGLGQNLPEYRQLMEGEAKKKTDSLKAQAEIDKLTTDTNKTQAEIDGTLPQTPAQVETARHNVEMERIQKLQVGRESAANAETMRHNKATEAQNEAAPTLSPDALKLTAHQFAMTGQLPPMGMGKQGASVRTSIINEAANQYKDLDLPSQVAAYKANQKSLTNVTETLDTLESFSKAAGKNLDQFVTLASKLPDTGVPWANMPIRLLNDKLVGAEWAPAVNAARAVATREVARITGDPKLKGVLSDAARHEVDSLVPGDITFAQLKRVIPVLKADMDNVHTSLNEQKTAIQGRIKLGSSTPPAGPKPTGRFNPATGKIEPF